jgi:hypothetical protein
VARLAEAEYRAGLEAARELQEDAGLSTQDYEVLVHLTDDPRVGSG